MKIKSTKYRRQEGTSISQTKLKRWRRVAIMALRVHTTLEGRDLNDAFTNDSVEMGMDCRARSINVSTSRDDQLPSIPEATNDKDAWEKLHFWNANKTLTVEIAVFIRYWILSRQGKTIWDIMWQILNLNSTVWLAWILTKRNQLKLTYCWHQYPIYLYTRLYWHQLTHWRKTMLLRQI